MVKIYFQCLREKFTEQINFFLNYILNGITHSLAGNGVISDPTQTLSTKFLSHLFKVRETSNSSELHDGTLSGLSI